MLRQRTFAIFIRPYFNRAMGGNVVRIDYKGVPKAGNASDLGFTGTDVATRLLGNGEGGTESNAVMETGGWTMWYSGTSFKQLREKFKPVVDKTKNDLEKSQQKIGNNNIKDEINLSDNEYLSDRANSYFDKTSEEIRNKYK